MCEVIIDGRPVEEYGTKVEGTTTSCWIVAEEGSSMHFAIRRKIRRQGREIGSQLLAAELFLGGLPQTGDSVILNTAVTRVFLSQASRQQPQVPSPP